VPFERRMKCATIAIKRIGFGDVQISREILIFEAAVVLHAEKSASLHTNDFELPYESLSVKLE
jgi:hypothetical protein